MHSHEGVDIEGLLDASGAGRRAFTKLDLAASTKLGARMARHALCALTNYYSDDATAVQLVRKCAHHARGHVAQRRCAVRMLEGCLTRTLAGCSTLLMHGCLTMLLVMTLRLLMSALRRSIQHAFDTKGLKRLFA